MVARIRHVTVDSKDAYAQAQFWSAVTGWPLDPDAVAGDAECEIAPPQPESVEGLLFIVVPEGKTAKNRMHLDLTPTDRTRDAEVVRLQGLGAAIAEDHRTPEGPGWVVMTDPEGNEFCVERSAAERAGG
jgi:predicted enzyme related to lactoylglutathione lyase